jgi:histidyl-tRNA synthetase
MIERVKGTRDILPDEVDRWQFLEDRAREVFSQYGFREIRTPIFESTELFQRGIGAGTDIVSKEMYTFADRKGRSLTLRPENTAPVARAYIEHQMYRRSEIERLYYVGPMFRYERPQKGRMRQFSQIGVEVFGSDHPVIDAETLQMLVRYLDRIGIRPVRVSLNSVGCETCRPGYRDVLRAFLLPHRDRMCGDCQRRIEVNPLRCFDCKVADDRRLLEGADTILDHICDACSTHFAEVKLHLERLEVPFDLDPRLVRGLDYYCRTTFEVSLAGLGAQNALLGGGRYDGLVQSLGGPPVPGFGFAAGEERLVLSLPVDAELPQSTPEVYIVTLGEPALRQAPVMAARLRSQGRRVVLDPLPAKSLRAQLRRANDLGARFVLIVGEQEIARGRYTLKRMSDGAQVESDENGMAGQLEEMIRA